MSMALLFTALSPAGRNHRYSLPSQVWQALLLVSRYSFFTRRCQEKNFFNDFVFYEEIANGNGNPGGNSYDFWSKEASQEEKVTPALHSELRCGCGEGHKTGDTHQATEQF